MIADAAAYDRATYFVVRALRDPKNPEAWSSIKSCATHMENHGIKPPDVRLVGPNDNKLRNDLLQAFRERASEAETEVRRLKDERVDSDRELVALKAKLKASEGKRRELRARVKRLEADIDPNELSEIKTLRINYSCMKRDLETARSMFAAAEECAQKWADENDELKRRLRERQPVVETLRETILRALHGSYRTTSSILGNLGIEVERADGLAELHALKAEGLVWQSSAHSHWKLAPKEDEA